MRNLASTALRHHFVDASGIRIHAIEFDPGTAVHQRDRPPLLMLHGVTGHAWLWLDVATALSASHRVIAIDLRGHGDSQWSSVSAYETADHVSDLNAVANALELPRFSVAGLSWGGLITIGYSARFADRLERIAIIDVEASFSQPTDAVPERPAEFDSLESVEAWERQANPRAGIAAIASAAQNSVRPTAAGRWVRKHDPFFLRSWPFRRDDRWSELRALRAPALFISAQNSFVRASVMQEMAARTPGAEFVSIPDCGHLIPLEAPAALAAQLHQFLS